MSEEKLTEIDKLNCFTVAEVAEMLKTSRQYVYRLIKDGKIKAFSFGNQSCRVTAGEIERFIQENLRR